MAFRLGCHKCRRTIDVKVVKPNVLNVFACREGVEK
jgi:hypothetical protein